MTSITLRGSAAMCPDGIRLYGIIARPGTQVIGSRCSYDDGL